MRIDRERVKLVAAKIATLRTSTDYFVPSLGEGATPDEVARFWLFVIGICQSTRTARGVVDGEAVRGSDYLIMRARRRCIDDPNAFDERSVREWSTDDLRSFFSDDDAPEGCSLDRIGERHRLLVELAAWLDDRWDGRLTSLFDHCEDRVAGAPGIVDKLAQIQAYEDPAGKKAHLLLLFLRRLGVFSPRDPESLRLAVDYHIARVLLRVGVVRVDDDVRRRLVSGEPVNAAFDVALRRLLADAGTALAEASGQDLLDVDNLLWMVGRNCCFYEHAPVCREGDGPCTHRDSCSLLTSTDYACPDRCPLEGACLGSLDPRFAELREHVFDTHYY